ncbi:class I SAM-dependent methyltransferase [Kiloniella majae]|uniref:class I SAM-dependent methyltransferase n=1 Tax=Kiloniella majae TaxID=1938558 RepID=UPI000A277176|nr:class I SAM-dependent methyltransferase [Kiloniella majae]
MNQTTKDYVAEHYSEINSYLQTLYENIFDADSIESHIKDYLGFTFADQVAPLVARQVPEGGKVLDIGCGFGSFVLAARRLGIDASGVEMASFEVDFAKRRIQHEMPDCDPDKIYSCADARTLDIKQNSQDAVTFWNVLEHIEECESVLAYASEILRPGGLVYIICPNYFSFRNEAHYQVPWFPLMPRWIANRYLRWKGKDPKYFEESIFYTTNWGVLNSLRKIGFEAFDLGMTIPLSFKFNLRTVHYWLRYPHYIFKLYNPFVGSVVLAARKK